ncbi:TPA: hypothetical protein ACH3X2_000166 [Trebouxia sp. C0005]
MLQAEGIWMETASQDSLDGSRFVATQMKPSSAIFALGGLAGRSMLAMFMPAKVSHPKQSNSQFVSQSLLSGYAALSELVCSSFTLSLVEQEDPGALVTPPKISAAGNFTFEENHKHDYVLDVAPEPAKKSNRAVKAGKKTLEELQLEYIKLRNKKRVLDSKCQALQKLCSKQRLEIDVLREEASHKGKLSATVSLLEMEVKDLKASLTSESAQSLQKLLTATEANAAARVTDLNRKAAAARELAESLRQEFSQAAAQQAQQLSELQQQLTASLEKFACLQQECADANQRHEQELADLQKQHAQTPADMESSLQSRSSADAAQHASVVLELQAQVAAAAQQHRDSSAQAQVRHRRQLAAQHAISRRMLQHEVTTVRGYWMQQEAAVKKDSKEALKAAESCHSAELALVRAELSAVKQGEADRVAAVKQQHDSKLRDARSCQATMVTQLQQELAVADGLQSTQRPGQAHSPTTTHDCGAAQSGDQELPISLSALELLSSSSNALSSSNIMSTSITVSKDIAQCWLSSADAAVTAAALSSPLVTIKAYPLLEKWLAAETDQSTMAAQESVPAKHITSASKWQDALPACNTILTVRTGSAAPKQLQQQTLTSHSLASASKSNSSNMRLQAGSALTCKASRSCSSGELQLQTCSAEPGRRSHPISAWLDTAGPASASCSTAASHLLISSSSLVRPSGTSSSTPLTMAAQTPAGCYQPSLDQQQQQQFVTALPAGRSHMARSNSNTSAESAQAVASLVGEPTSAQAHTAIVADIVQTSSVQQTVLGWASGVKKAASDQASIMEETVPDQATLFENFQPVAVPVRATAKSADKESSSVIDSYTKSSLFSSPWDAAAAAAELDASEYDEVDYELLWTKGPQYWYDHDDDWGIDDE